MRLVTKKDHEENLKRNEKKWTKPLMAAGWTAIPSILLERQQALGLDALDINIIFQIAKHWWYPEKLPFPSKKSVAECIGVDVSTVQRRIRKMERDGLIKRNNRFHPKYGQQTNEYDFSGLIDAVTPYAKEAIEVKKQRKKEDAARRKRKRPLKLVKK
jgi:DNA-binding transcriptional regulator YhcF (GntR family)